MTWWLARLRVVGDVTGEGMVACEAPTPIDVLANTSDVLELSTRGRNTLPEAGRLYVDFESTITCTRVKACASNDIVAEADKEAEEVIGPRLEDCVFVVVLGCDDPEWPAVVEDGI